MPFAKTMSRGGATNVLACKWLLQTMTCASDENDGMWRGTIPMQRRLTCTDITLVHRRRRWTNVILAQVERPSFHELYFFRRPVRVPGARASVRELALSGRVTPASLPVYYLKRLRRGVSQAICRRWSGAGGGMSAGESGHLPAGPPPGNPVWPRPNLYPPPPPKPTNSIGGKTQAP